MTSLAIAHATNHNDFVKIWNEIWDLHKLDFDLCANCGLKHLKGTKCHLQPEKETWFFEKMDDKTKSPQRSDLLYGKVSPEEKLKKSLMDCGNCIHYKNNDCGDYEHPCPELINDKTKSIYKSP